MTPTVQSQDFSAMPLVVGSDEGRLFMAMKMFELGRATLAKAAEVAGYSVRGVMDVLGHHGIPVVSYPASELASEIAW
jgi:predicted HTH domain antitoxin